MMINKPYHLLLYQAVQIQVAGRSESIPGIVARILKRQIVIRFAEGPSLPEGFAPGVSVVVRGDDNGGLRVGDSHVVELSGPPRPSVVIKLPRFKTIQNRQFFRMQLDFPCSLQILEREGAPMPMAKDDKARILDISGGGARVSTTCALSVGDHLQLKIVASADGNRRSTGAKPASARTIQVIAEVMRVAPPSESAANVCQAGVEFEILSGESQDRLVDFLFAMQRLRKS